MAVALMAETNDDPPMLLLRGAGGELASRPIALTLAEMIFKNVYGDEDFKTQAPLHIVDGGDRWIIEGGRRTEEHPAPPGEPARGKAQIVILKANCQVVKLTQKMVLPAPKGLK
jgi:hypothetical protein